MDTYHLFFCLRQTIDHMDFGPHFRVLENNLGFNARAGRATCGSDFVVIFALSRLVPIVVVKFSFERLVRWLKRPSKR